MNNLKKLGLTALAGSLVAVTANAGEMTVSFWRGNKKINNYTKAKSRQRNCANAHW